MITNNNHSNYMTITNKNNSNHTITTIKFNTITSDNGPYGPKGPLARRASVWPSHLGPGPKGPWWPSGH